MTVSGNGWVGTTRALVRSFRTRVPPLAVSLLVRRAATGGPPRARGDRLRRSQARLGMAAPRAAGQELGSRVPCGRRRPASTRVAYRRRGCGRGRNPRTTRPGCSRSWRRLCSTLCVGGVGRRGKSSRNCRRAVRKKRRSHGSSMITLHDTERQHLRVGEPSLRVSRPFEKERRRRISNKARVAPHLALRGRRLGQQRRLRAVSYGPFLATRGMTAESII